MGIVFDGPESPRTAALVTLVADELETTRGKGKIALPASSRRYGDWTRATAAKNLRALLAEPDVNVVWTLGVIGSSVALRESDLSKPVVAPFVAAADLATIPEDRIPAQLSLVVWSLDLERDLRTLRDLAEVRHVAFMMSDVYLRAIPQLAERARNVARTAGFKLTVVPLGADPDAALAKVPTDADALYLGPHPQLDDQGMERLVDGIAKAELVSFSALGRPDVERGILAGVADPGDGTQLARNIALNTDAVLRGESPSRLRTPFVMKESLVVNMRAAKQANVTVPWEVMTEAELLGVTRPKVARHLTLESVVDSVRDRNLDLMINEEDVVIAQQGFAQARAALLPRVEASLTGSWIDADRAGLGAAQGQMSWMVSGRQVIFDQSLWASFNIQRDLRESVKHGNQAARLDAVQSAVTAYLNILRTRTVERIQRQNLKTTRTNLELARARQRVGSVSVAEHATTSFGSRPPSPTAAKISWPRWHSETSPRSSSTACSTVPSERSSRSPR